MRALTTMAACAVVLCGCNTASRSHVTEIRGRVWEAPAEITVPNSDTLGLYDLSIALRHDGSPAGSVVEMTVRTVTPDSLWTEERIAVSIGDDGRSRSSQHETVCPYRRGVRLSRTGDYRITVTPLRPVKGVVAVGVDMSQSVKD